MITRTEPLLRAIRLALDGDWEGAHQIAQADPGADAAWIHAWLHRIEGDDANAEYWYRRAGRSPAEGSTAEEAATIAASLSGNIAGPG
ncbi:hypothetical protein ACLF3G_09030 [Falsiroseomonas sp. HC035]|uniref:hypothetical protein n=1 Tax=Falsiroseomonas sp. HC035 TaxID=3390999 RepID=UPI003D31C88E